MVECAYCKYNVTCTGKGYTFAVVNEKKLKIKNKLNAVLVYSNVFRCSHTTAHIGES